MAKILDQSPISVTRIRRSMRIEIIYTVTGGVERVIAHRWAVAQQAGVDATTPTLVNPTVFEAAAIPPGVLAQLLNLAAIIDNADSGPAMAPP